MTSRSWTDRALRAILTHPLVMPIKRGARDAYWHIRGQSVGNPPLPATVRSLLFVCKGNICRSPFAAELAQRLSREAGLPALRCASAGISASQAARSPQDACAAAADYGIELGVEPPRRLTQELMESHDLIVVMEAGQMNELVTRYPGRRSNVFLLPLVENPRGFGYAQYHIADPFGQPRAAFDVCFQRIDGALRELVETLLRAARAQPGVRS